MHGNVRSAVATHSSGAVVGMMTVAAGVWTLAFAVVGPKHLRLPNQRMLIVAALGVMAAVFVEWIFRLASQGFGLPI